MSRLNEIMSVLSDDALRAQYDAELKEQRAAEEASIQKAAEAALHAWKMCERGAGIQRLWPARLWFGALACVVAGFALFLLMSDWREAQRWQTMAAQLPDVPKLAVGSAVRVEAPVHLPSPVLARSSAGARPASSDKAGANRGESDDEDGGNRVSPLVEEARKAMEGKSVRPSLPPPPDIAIALPQPLPGMPTDLSPPPPRTAGEAWNGEWKYLESLGGAFGGEFSPVSIYMQLHASGRRVRGVYKARYKVSRFFSDKVEFAVEGWSDSNEWLSGVWKDPSGATGQFELKKVDGKVVEMNWWTTAFGRRRALASGLARLMEIDR